jgi:DNA-binding NarL/FixJ family response regulator
VTRKRVIVVESENLLNAGIYSLLSANGHLDVIGVTSKDENFFDVFDRVKPHIIILDEKTMSRNMTAYMLFTKNYPRLRTIVLSLGTNNVQVCDKQVVHIQNFDDFMNQIGV